jgi:hypothetical protein
MMLTAQGSTANHRVTVSPSLKILDFHYEDDVVCLFDSISEAQKVLDSLKGSADKYGMQFGLSKRKALLQDWIGANPTTYPTYFTARRYKVTPQSCHPTANPKGFTAERGRKYYQVAQAYTWTVSFGCPIPR